MPCVWSVSEPSGTIWFGGRERRTDRNGDDTVVRGGVYVGVFAPTGDTGNW